MHHGYYCYFQLRTLVGVFAADSQALRDYVTTLHQLSSKLVAAHNQLTSAYQDLSKHLKSYKNIVSRVCSPIKNFDEGCVKCLCIKSITFFICRISWTVPLFKWNRYFKSVVLEINQCNFFLQKFSVDNDKGEVVSSTLEKFASHISEVRFKCLFIVTIY